MSRPPPPPALTELLQAKLSYDRVVARQDATRRAKLQSFLDQHQHASQWAVCCAALEDGLRHGVVPTDAMICDAMERCGSRRKLDKAKELYTTFYKKVGRARPMAAHLAFMTACSRAGEFSEAHKQLHKLLAFDKAKLKKDPQHHPVVNDDLMTEYLRTALAASTRQSHLKQQPPQTLASAGTSQAASSSSTSTPSGAEAPWAVALGDLIAVRRDAALRPHNALTPLLLESATQLAEMGGQWALCLRLLKAAAAEQLVIPPESYDAAIRACYHHNRHTDVVDLMSQLVATKTPPDERSVRLALVSAEEVTASQEASSSAWALSLTLLEAMKLNGIPLYQQSYEAPLRTCAMAGKWVEALGVLDTMRRDARPVSTELYCVALAARMAACSSAEEVRRLLDLPVATEGAPSAVMYMAALRACMRLKDWRAFDAINKEMINREMPETFDKMRLLVEAAYERGNYHAVMARFARFDNITSYERKRVQEPGSFVRFYEQDFAVPERLLNMVFEAYEKVKDSSKDPIVEVALRAAVRHRESQASGPMLGGQKDSSPEWMFSQEARDERSPPTFQ